MYTFYANYLGIQNNSPENKANTIKNFLNLNKKEKEKNKMNGVCIYSRKGLPPRHKFVRENVLGHIHR